MAISFVASEQADTGASTSLTINVPTGTADDDVMVCLFGNGKDDGGTPSATGWTNIGFVESAVVANAMYSIFYKVASSEPASHTFSYAGSSSNLTSGIIATFRGVDTSTPLDVTYVEGSHYLKQQNDNTPTPQPITTNTDGACVIVTCWFQGNATTGINVPTGYTEAEQVIATNKYADLAYKIVATAGTETPSNFSMVNGAGTEDAGMFTIALKPAAAAGGVPIFHHHRQLIGAV